MAESHRADEGELMPEPQIVLVLNSGSTSLKFAAFANSGDGERAILEGEIGGIGQGKGETELKLKAGEEPRRESHSIATQEDAIAEAASLIEKYLPSRPAVVGHRVVHGGPRLRDHTVITPDVLRQLEAATHFAPLHIPPALRIIRKTEQLFPSATQIACFDTTFHKFMPEVAARIPLPTPYFEAGIQRYGFHGLSCESVMSRVPAPQPERIVIAHLGSGSSITAVFRGKSIDTTMSMTPTGGIPMSFRTGDLDPSILIYLLRTQGMSAAELETLVNRECGLVAVSNGEADMRALLARADKPARLAVDIYTTAVRKAVGSYMALMGGLDLLIFTGGIGQNSAEIRRRVLVGLDTFGLSEGGPKVTALPAEEEIQIARHCRELMER
jgi:acetate kinase